MKENFKTIFLYVHDLLQKFQISISKNTFSLMHLQCLTLRTSSAHSLSKQTSITLPCDIDASISKCCSVMYVAAKLQWKFLTLTAL